MTALAALVAEEIGKPVDPQVEAFARDIAAQYGASARTVLFYGSCLRTAELDGQMLDFYVIVSDYREAYEGSWLPFANRHLPPNVFPAAHDGLQAKVAVLSEADFARLCSVRAGDVSVWARFAQPSRLVWVSDDKARGKAVAAIAEAPRTLFHYSLPMLPTKKRCDALEVWRRGFALTYGAELRAERKERSQSVVDADPDRYRRFGEAVLAENPVPARRAEQAWSRFRRRGKALTLARLAKATTTYAGGVDYIAWKINRHAGTEIVVTDWHRRHPILGALTMLPRLIRGGAIR